MIDGRRILFVADHAPPFSGVTYRTSGVGGTPALTVLLAEECARRGADVTIATAGLPAAADGPVHSVAADSLNARPFDIVVLTKRWSEAARVPAALRVFLVTDVHVDPAADLPRCVAWADACFAGSPFGADGVAGLLRTDRITSLGWPVDVDAYAGAPATRANVLLYCSVPDRGLYYLKDIFPAVRRAVPDATLVITSDFSLWGLESARASFEPLFAGQRGVEYAGHVDRPALVAAQMRAKVMAYPCSFPEGFCLSAAECMAAGAVPVTTDAFALRTTVGPAGVLIPGLPRSWLYRRRFTRAVVDLLTRPGHWQDRSTACRARAAEQFRPAAVLDRLIAALSGLTPRVVP